MQMYLDSKIFQPYGRQTVLFKLLYFASNAKDASNICCEMFVNAVLE